MPPDQLAYIAKRVDYLCERIDEHIDGHAAEAETEATYRRETEGRLSRLETALQTRSALGAVGIVLAALAQPALSALGVKHP